MMYYSHLKSHIEIRPVKAFFALAFLLIFPTAFAQIPSDNKLQDFIHHTQQQNSGIQAAFYEWKADVEKIAVFRDLPNSSFRLGFFLENTVTAAGPQEYTLVLTRIFSWFGKLGTVRKIRTEQAEFMFQILHLKRLKLEAQTEMVYYDYYFLGKTIDIARLNNNLIQNWEWVINPKYKMSISSHFEVIDTQINSIEVEDYMKSLKARKRPPL